MAQGHQSRLASASAAGSVVTAAHAVGEALDQVVGDLRPAPRPAGRWRPPAPPASSIGGVGAPGPRGGSGCGAVMGGP